MDHYYAVIMAGGGGTRLWPLSRQARPKQMIALFDEQTLFQMAVRRLDGIFTPENIYVVTVEQQAVELRRQCPEIPGENFLIEPMPRGTASVVGLAAAVLARKDPQAVMAVLAADHFINNVNAFHRLLLAAWQAARAGYLVTLGVEPTFPATGFGYIKQGEPCGNYAGQPLFQVAKFREKPGQAEAVEMLAEGGHSWNSGMFVWQVDQILAEIRQQMPELAGKLTEIGRSWQSLQFQATVERLWPTLLVETIDYGIMEHARNLAVLPAADLEWSDVGSWDSIFDVLKGDPNGNVIVGAEHLGLKTSNSLVFGNRSKRLVVTIGVENLVVVDTGDVLLVCSRQEAQQVRQVVDQLKNSGTDYL